MECLSAAADYIITLTQQLNVASEQNANKPKLVGAKTFFLAHVKRLRAAYDICQPANVLDNEMLSLSQCFMAVASYIRKTSGDKHDAESMNRAVEKMVAEALKEKVMNYFTLLDDEQAQMVISYIETIDVTQKKKQKSLADLKGKIQFADGYDYKAMRRTQ